MRAIVPQPCFQSAGEVEACLGDATPFLLPQMSDPLCVPRRKHGMRPRWIHHGQVRIVRQVFNHHTRVLNMLGFPLGLRQHQPRQRFLRAPLQHSRKKRLCMPNKSDFGARQPQLLPNEPRETVALRAAGRISVTARRQDQAATLWLRTECLNCSTNLVHESTDHQRVSWIDIIVMNHRIGMLPPRFRQQPP